ncbi:MAG: hypothetical protein LQ351_006726 [Letrouitia transgressa]|nr:MAG: hypothetical protein LQ351_006726 [Letrouitia transgressa]
MRRSYEEACQEIYRRSRILAAQGGFIGNLAYLAEWPADQAECLRLSGIKNPNTNAILDSNTSQGFHNVAPAIATTVDPSRNSHVRSSSASSSKILDHPTPTTGRPQFAKSRPLYPFKIMPAALKRPLHASNAQNGMTQSFSQASKEAMTIDPLLLPYNLNQQRFEGDFTFTCPSGSKTGGGSTELAGPREFRAEAPPVPIWSKPSNLGSPYIQASAEEQLSLSDLFDEVLSRQPGPIFGEDQDNMIYDTLNNAGQDVDTNFIGNSQVNTATDSASVLDEDRFYPESLALSPDGQAETMSICSEEGVEKDSKSPSDDQHSAYKSSTNDDDSESKLTSVASEFVDEFLVESRPHKQGNKVPKPAQRNYRQPVNKRQKVTKKRGTTAASKNAKVIGNYQTRFRVHSLRSRKY